MTGHNRTIAAAAGALLLAGAALAQGQGSGTTTTGTTTTVTTTKVESGVVVYAGGNTLITKEADGVTRKHIVPDGFNFQMGGKNVTLADLKPGDHITAVITDVKQVTPVTVTRVVKGKVMESSMDSILVQNAKGQLVKYSSKDAEGRDVTIIMNGKEVALSSLKAGDQLTATIVTKYPPQVSTLRSVNAHVTAPPAAPAAAAAPPVAVAAAPAPKAKLPKTASPLPLVGLTGVFLVLLGAGLTLRRLSR
ncbi:MAG: hypothetical protein ACLPJH_09830 [Myxococcaceae bacterium]